MMQATRATTAALVIVATLHAASTHAEAELPKEVTINGVEFVLIPAGWFYKTGGIPQAGGDYRFLDEEGGGNVRVWLDSYYLAKYEARARDLVRFLNSGDRGGLDYAGTSISCSVRRDDKGAFYQLRPADNLPATHLSWTLSDRWARWMGFRLPTEYEWEKAARGSDQRTYPWGDDFPDETYAGFKTRSDCHTWPVDSFRKGVSPFGIYNMAGNVREFVADWYSHEVDRSLSDGAQAPTASEAQRSHRDTKTAPSAWDAGPWKILKGGRWASREDQLRIGARIYYLQDDPFRCNGTRFAIDINEVRKKLAEGNAIVTAN